jgi:hypothetical protein
MADERQASDSDGQNGANAQEIDCRRQRLGQIVSLLDAI